MCLDNKQELLSSPYIIARNPFCSYLRAHYPIFNKYKGSSLSQLLLCVHLTVTRELFKNGYPPNYTLKHYPTIFDGLMIAFWKNKGYKLTFSTSTSTALRTLCITFKYAP